MKKFTAFLLVLVMVLSILPTAAFAAGGYENGFKYVSAGGKSTIIMYKGSDKEVEIPETLGGGRVYSIQASAFENCRSIEKLTIPASITRIGKDAFKGCTGLKYVILKGNQRTFSKADNAFGGVRATLILPQRWFYEPEVGKNVRWLGGIFDVERENEHTCRDEIDTRDNKCDICGRPMNDSNPGASRNSCDLAVSIGKAAVRTAMAVGTAVAVTTVKAVKTTAIVVRSILKWF